jgi:hypothetical protein
MQARAQRLMAAGKVFGSKQRSALDVYCTLHHGRCRGQGFRKRGGDGGCTSRFAQEEKNTGQA